MSDSPADRLNQEDIDWILWSLGVASGSALKDGPPERAAKIFERLASIVPKVAALDPKEGGRT